MRIEVNGTARDVPAGTTVGALVRSLELTSERVAVERNGRLVTRSEHERIELAEGDRIEVVTLVGGG